MSKHNLTYRGVEVPQVLDPRTSWGEDSGRDLRAFLAGVDATLDAKPQPVQFKTFVTPRIDLAPIVDPGKFIRRTNATVYGSKGEGKGPESLGVWLIVDGVPNVYYRNHFGDIEHSCVYLAHEELLKARYDLGRTWVERSKLRGL